MLDVNDLGTDKFICVSSLESTVKLNYTLLEFICVISEKNVTKVVLILNEVIEVISNSLLFLLAEVASGFVEVSPRLNDSFESKSKSVIGWSMTILFPTPC